MSISVFDVLEALPAAMLEDEKTWAGIGAADALSFRTFDPEQYTMARAQGAYRTGYRLAVKLALAGPRSDLDGARNDFRQAGYAKGEVESMQRERAACAALCREAGCACEELDGAVYGPADFGPCRYCHIEHVGACASPAIFPGQIPTHYLPDDVVLTHDPRCPEALASRIEARGGHQPKSP